MSDGVRMREQGGNDPFVREYASGVNGVTKVLKNSPREVTRIRYCVPLVMGIIQYLGIKHSTFHALFRNSVLQRLWLIL